MALSFLGVSHLPSPNRLGENPHCNHRSIACASHDISIKIPRVFSDKPAAKPLLQATLALVAKVTYHAAVTIEPLIAKLV
jgi:hypothetical protein